jgi:hypothetical protein
VPNFSIFNESAPQLVAQVTCATAASLLAHVSNLTAGSLLARVSNSTATGLLAHAANATAASLHVQVSDTIASSLFAHVTNATAASLPARISSPAAAGLLSQVSNSTTASLLARVSNTTAAGLVLRTGMLATTIALINVAGSGSDDYQNTTAENVLQYSAASFAVHNTGTSNTALARLVLSADNLTYRVDPTVGAQSITPGQQFFFVRGRLIKYAMIQYASLTEPLTTSLSVYFQARI